MINSCKEKMIYASRNWFTIIQIPNGGSASLSKVGALLNTKTTKFVSINILIISMALILSSCLNPIEIPEASPYAPAPAEVTGSSSVTAAVPVMTTILPPYPTSSENFTKTPSISGAEAEKRIIELGAGEDLTAMKDWYRKSGISDSNMLPVLYEQGGEVHWNLAAKSGNGNFLKFTITSGEEANQDVRAMGMVAYLYNKPEFKVSELIKPAELNGTTQQMIWDKSGWSVIGAFKGESLVGWFNADKNVWIMEQNQQVEPSATSEPIQENFSYGSSINPERLADVVDTKVPVVGGYLLDLTAQVNYPTVGFLGYPVAYSLERNEDGTHLFVLFAAAGGLMKADVKVFNFREREWPQSLREINYINEEEAKEISDALDSFIKRLDEGGEFKESFGYVLLKTINNEVDAQGCLAHLDGLKDAERLCAYDASNEPLTSQQMLNKIKSSVVIPNDGETPKDALDFDKYPTLSPEGNMYINFGL